MTKNQNLCETALLADRYLWLRDQVYWGYPSSEGSTNKDAYMVITGYDDERHLGTAGVDKVVDELMKNELFTSRQLQRLTGFASLYRTFQPAPFDFYLNDAEEAEVHKLAEHKWRYGNNVNDDADFNTMHARFYASKKADKLLAEHAANQGFMVQVNNELVTKIPGYDFTVTLPALGAPPEYIRFETKRMNSADKTIVFKSPFTQTHSHTNWRDFDLLIAWDVDALQMFRPWAIVVNKLFSAECYSKVWKLNNGKGGGSNLNLATLPAPYNAGKILL